MDALQSDPGVFNSRSVKNVSNNRPDRHAATTCIDPREVRAEVTGRCGYQSQQLRIVCVTPNGPVSRDEKNLISAGERRPEISGGIEGVSASRDQIQVAIAIKLAVVIAVHMTDLRPRGVQWRSRGN